MYEPQNEPAVRFLPGQKTQGFVSVRVTNPLRHSGSGCWPGNDPNRTELPANNRTAGGLPGPVANTICNEQTPGALHVEQMAVQECKQHGDGKLCNGTRFFFLF